MEFAANVGRHRYVCERELVGTFTRIDWVYCQCKGEWIGMGVPFDSGLLIRKATLMVVSFRE